MSLAIIPTVKESELDEFLQLFTMKTLSSISLVLYNGTGSGYTELPNGGHIAHRKFEMEVPTIEAMKIGLECVDHNQVQRCKLHFQKQKNRYVSVTFDLLAREISVDDAVDLFDMQKMLEYCRKKDIYKLSIKF